MAAAEAVDADASADVKADASADVRKDAKSVAKEETVVAEDVDVVVQDADVKEDVKTEAVTNAELKLTADATTKMKAKGSAIAKDNKGQSPFTY